ncbi:MAG: cytochrome c [Methylobacteriaceae bacterium]|nr:cytochrome c [Methylobacteriaceae bacterium]
MRAATLLAGLALCALAPAAEAQSASAARGRALAEQHCARCHAVGRAGASRHERAPPLRVVARKYRPADLEEALAEGIVVSHRAPEMPEFSFTPRQIDDLIAHLARLRAK